MTRVDQLIACYEKFVSLPWDKNLAGKQRTWFLVYDKNDERRVRARVEQLDQITRKAKHGWVTCDLTSFAAQWLVQQDYLETYFQEPDEIGSLVPEMKIAVVAAVREALQSPDADDNTVVAVIGGAGLFGFLRLSEIVEEVAANTRGRLLVFFPGEREGNNYRLLDAREGWNYLAIPITSSCGDLV
jgi:hypothetical protein